jgi:hypothetical protein
MKAIPVSNIFKPHLPRHTTFFLRDWASAWLAPPLSFSFCFPPQLPNCASQSPRPETKASRGEVWPVALASPLVQSRFQVGLEAPLPYLLQMCWRPG